MAPRTVSRSAVASSSRVPLGEKNLLQHVNAIRKVPNFDSFGQVMQATGDDWMDGMLAQALEIRLQWW